MCKNVHVFPEAHVDVTYTVQGCGPEAVARRRAG
jgi:hypothetical protein